MSSKRPRTPTRSSSSSSSSLAPSSPPASKSTRTHQSPGSGGHHAGLQCTLPPTCNPPRNPPTHIGSTKDLEAHYATYHAHVCESHGCGCVFPDARLLELHQTECHDPLAALRKDRGEKIFACHLATCPRLFSSPKTRRLHLIDSHAYPKEYFFAVTNKGVGGLLKRWGEGVSLLRGEWKGRAGDDEEDEDMEEDAKGRERPPHLPRQKPQSPAQKQQQNKPAPASDAIDVDVDDDLHSLTAQMTALALGVPQTIRFGRGGKSGGFGSTGDGGVGVGVGLGPGTNHPGTGAGARGRGRGRSVSAGGAGSAPAPSADVTHMIPAQVMRNAKARATKPSAPVTVEARAPVQARPAPVTTARGRGMPVSRGAGVGRGMGRVVGV